MVVATATVGGRTTTWRTTGRTHEDQMAAARRVQQMLDGFRGTGCDVADYLRLIQALAD